jgi:hypothetical protein
LTPSPRQSLAQKLAFLPAHAPPKHCCLKRPACRAPRKHCCLKSVSNDTTFRLACAVWGAGFSANKTQRDGQVSLSIARLDGNASQSIAQIVPAVPLQRFLFLFSEVVTTPKMNTRVALALRIPGCQQTAAGTVGQRGAIASLRRDEAKTPQRGSQEGKRSAAEQRGRAKAQVLSAGLWRRNTRPDPRCARSHYRRNGRRRHSYHRHSANAHVSSFGVGSERVAEEEASALTLSAPGKAVTFTILPLVGIVVATAAGDDIADSCWKARSIPKSDIGARSLKPGSELRIQGYRKSLL